MKHPRLPLLAADRQDDHAKILVVDDDPLHQKLIAHVLTAAGFGVSIAGSGKEALEVARRVEPDLIVLDAEMPEMDGFGVVEELRRDPALQTLPTLMVSGHDDQDAQLRAFALGVDDFIAKPVHRDDLVARVSAHLRVADAWHSKVSSLSATVRHELIAEGALSGAVDVQFERWLDRLLETSAFDIWFQPIVDMRTGWVVAQEALVRFHDRSSPAEVFEKAASSDRAALLELTLVEASILAARSLPGRVRLHVNLSPATAAAPELSEILARSDRPVVVEITERDLFDAAAARLLRTRLPAGSALAADDVGAGYSGLSQLLDVRPDVLKIDRMLVAAIDIDPARQALVAGLVRFADSTGSTIVGEGIERADEARTLLDLGVQIGQGYHFGRPGPVMSAVSTVAGALGADRTRDAVALRALVPEPS